MAAPVTFETFQQELASLVARFDREHAHFTNPDYNEAMVREDFLNPFFRALGWDVGNSKGLIHTEREVDIEVRTALSGKQTRADYVFRVGRVERFTCEAKKPAETLHAGHIYQAKRDAFARGIPIAVLSDFEELKIYIVGARPRLSEPHVGEFKKLHFREYLAASHELWELLAYERVAAGAIDQLIDNLPKRALKLRGRQGYLIKPDRTKSLDADFLNFLDEARRALGSDLLKYNDREDLLTGHRLNEAAQRIIDRLVFLRICEDRGIDTGGLLDSLLNGWLRQSTNPPKLRREAAQSRLAIRDDGVHEDPGAYGASRAQPPEGSLYRELVEHVRSLDQRPPSYKPFFNGQLFKPHFSEELTVGDDFLANFIDELTDDDSGYNFADIKVEILGSAYERFLGNVLLPQGRGVKIEEKPEVRKAGGVYYTPRYIVDYIVEQTVARQLAGKSPKEVAKLRFLDPACGSGSFLLRVYERVMEHYLRWFMDNPAKQTKADCYLDTAGNVRLTTQLKRRILQENVYGVDIDAQAVEVTQLSLYLKMLEGENRESLRAQTELFNKEPLLPALDKNILCGNSLISSEFSLDPDELNRVNAFDWDIGFEAIMTKGGFDAVTGNPPYLNVDDTWGKNDPRLEALKIQYQHIYNDKTDILFYFLAKAQQLSKGSTGMIVSRAFLEAYKADKLRGFLAEKTSIREIVDFQNYQVFERVGITTCIIFFDQKKTESGKLDVYKLRAPKITPGSFASSLSNSNIFEHLTTERKKLSSEVWTFSPENSTLLNQKIDNAGEPISKILHIGQGMQTGLNDVFGKRTLSEVSEWKLNKKQWFYRATNSDIQRYSIRNRGEVLLWTEDAAIFDDLPLGLRNHLKNNESDLKARAAYERGNCLWWKFTWPLHKEYYARKRLICPFLANENRFALVEKEPFIGLTDTTVLFDNKQPESLLYILALLNSRLLTFRFKTIGKLKSGGILEYFWNSISKLPIRRIDFGNSSETTIHNRIVMLVEKINNLINARINIKTDSERATLENAIRKTDRDIDQLVYQLYGLTPEEIALVEGTAKAPVEAAE